MYLPREALVQQAIDRARQSGLLIVSSPPGTVKISLLQLVVQKLQDVTSGSSDCNGYFLRPSRPEKLGLCPV